MRRLCYLLTIMMLTAVAPLHAQLRWIADAPLPGSTHSTLYQMLADGKPIVLAVGTLSSESAQNLLANGALQDLATNHGADAFAAPYSAHDIHVLFMDVRVFAEKAQDLKVGLPVVSIDEENPLFSKPGWNSLYSILGTHLYLITPDRLVRPLKSQSAADIYAEMQAWSSKIKPTSNPDLRLLDAEMDGHDATVRVQNFSTHTIDYVELQVLKAGKEIARVQYKQHIPSLEDALISVPLPHGYNTRLTIIAKAPGDANEFNNRWSGLLRDNTSPSVAAGNLR